MFAYKKYKRILDLSIIIVAHVMPPFPIIWLFIWVVVPVAIWLEDKGPIFYTQTRIGKNGVLFKIYKFRTMIPNAELNGPVWASKTDPRITKVGKILRLTALDELPQILNIIKNDMSLVGPRAERPELHNQFCEKIPEFKLRLSVKPGLTGTAQINGPYDLEPQEKLNFDLKYIQSISFITDMAIIIKSIINTLTAKWDKPTKQNTK
ncbi:MAG TPA: hypothetical protein DEZ08_05095 [Dehalococcoidia bacterium]|jgi:lipopolysaccharide/colanic/teichoic acid biosynthesis glycosyltransferase|nr:hypothetical protein [Dehalococcoidia bacterium]